MCVRSDTHIRTSSLPCTKSLQTQECQNASISVMHVHWNSVTAMHKVTSDTGVSERKYQGHAHTLEQRHCDGIPYNMSSSLCFVSMAWRVMSCIANKGSKMCPSRLVHTKMTYSATISACSDSDQATAVGCKHVSRALFSTTALSTGELVMVKLDVAAQLTLPAWCCLLAMNTMQVTFVLMILITALSIAVLRNPWLTEIGISFSLYTGGMQCWDGTWGSSC